MRSRVAGIGVVLAASIGLLGVTVVTLGLTSPPASAPVAAANVDSAVTDAATAAFPTVEDHCYIEGMIPHHEQALELSSLVLGASGVGERTRALAEFIVADQSAEIQTMRAWQDAWRQAIPAGAVTGGGHADHAPASGAVPSGCGDHGHTGMRGMATPEQLAALDAAESVAAERLFLELMIVHHEGALDMATRAVTEASNAFVRSSGKHVLVEQAREIEAMTDLLETMP